MTIFGTKINISKEKAAPLLKAFLFFYSVLCSWYVIRPVRNEMAVQAGLENLPSLLGIVLIIMLLANPLYSWVVSKVNTNRIILYIYLFFILNLFVFLFGWTEFDAIGKVLIAKIFYIWCNVYSFFVVSIFWVKIINYFHSDEAKKYFGVISAGGSLGAFSGATIARYFSTEVCGNVGLDSGPFSLVIISILFLSIAILFSNSLKARGMNRSNEIDDEVILGGGGLDAITSLFTVSSVRYMAAYIVLWTALMTIGWMIALDIVQNWSSDPCQRTAFFARIEQIVTPLTLLCQFFITAYILRKIGIAAVLIAYGVILAVGLVGYATYPEYTTVLVVVIISRVFEYGFNKPTRETVFTALRKQDRYKSTVFLDTFVARSGEAFGSWFTIKGMLIIGLSSMSAAWVALPLAALLSWVGYQTARSTKVKGL